MTVYCKIINRKLVPANNNQDITGLTENPEIAIANGYLPFNEAEHALYEAGLAELQEDNTLRVITSDTAYIEDQKTKQKERINLEYVDKFNGFDIMWSRNVALGKKTNAQYTVARAALVSELVTKLSEV